MFRKYINASAGETRIFWDVNLLSFTFNLFVAVVVEYYLSMTVNYLSWSVFWVILPVYFIVVHLTTLSLAYIIFRRIIWWVMNNKLERVW
jgi:hypothetical protein